MLDTDASRFDNGWGIDPNTMYPDSAKHILAFDLIYCCSTYNLFDGITFNKLKSKEKALLQEKKKKAGLLAEQYEKTLCDMQKLEEAIQYLNSVYKVGQTVHHNRFGNGIILENSGEIITVDFQKTGRKKLETSSSAANGFVIVNDLDYPNRIREYKNILKEKAKIRHAVHYAEKQLAPYAIDVFHGTYDVPVKGKDQAYAGESEETYDFIICTIGAVDQEYHVSKPDFGFLFPTFRDRSSDDRGIAVYHKDPDKIEEKLIRMLLEKTDD